MKPLLGKIWNYFLGKGYESVSVPSLSFLNRPRNIDINYYDYIRLATLELISGELYRNNVKGNVAEVGVYKGKFARYINQFFPDRTFYLFDTFEGFDGKDKGAEIGNKYSTADQDFSNTSVGQVLGRMTHKEKCVVKKGYFPETAADVEDLFAFVSLDADLYQPIYSGLVFFYPRLSPGGYIMIHDFNNDHYAGVRQAVEQFCKAEQLNFVPLPDKAGTCIICKGHA